MNISLCSSHIYFILYIFLILFAEEYKKLNLQKSNIVVASHITRFQPILIRMGLYFVLVTCSVHVLYAFLDILVTILSRSPINGKNQQILILANLPFLASHLPFFFLCCLFMYSCFFLCRPPSYKIVSPLGLTSLCKLSLVPHQTTLLRIWDRNSNLSLELG